MQEAFDESIYGKEFKNAAAKFANIHVTELLAKWITGEIKADTTDDKLVKFKEFILNYKLPSEENQAPNLEDFAGASSSASASHEV